jgi:hypothetical protein
MPASRIYNPFVGSGGGGGGGVTPAQLADAEEIRTQEFNFASGSFVMFNIPANAKIVSVSVEIENAFDGAGASVQVGDTGNFGRLMSSSKNDPHEVSVYSSHIAYEYPTMTAIYISVVGGSATLGNGYVTVMYNLNN